MKIYITARSVQLSFQWCSHPVKMLHWIFRKRSLQCYGIMADFFQATLDNVPQMHFLNTELLQFRVGIILMNDMQILDIQRIILITTLDYVCNNHFHNLKRPWKLKSFLSPLISNSSKIPVLSFRIIIFSACLCCLS